MDTSTRAPGYDLFKLVVAIILLLIFICLILWSPANAPQTAIPTDTQVFLMETRSVTTTIAPPTSSPAATSLTDSSTQTSLPLPSPSSASTTDSLTLTVIPLPSPTGTFSGAQTATSISSPTGTSSAFTETAVLIPSPTATATPLQIQTSTPTLVPTSIPAQTQSPVPEPSPTQTVETPPAVDVCEAALSRSRLQEGSGATILRRLNFRTSPGIQNNWIRTNISGTQVEVIDGPVCLPHFIGAYVWWQIRLPDGQVGWSAESSLLGRFYFMEPNQ